ncbi:efflux RND transporter periplasmic adaptor subunit [Opitutus terrae]|uniref:Efflux transporter, RND family, MFP subunit n=1 Tax=Opitutus terrae (strain DSM 11246 / JCM 15787 / PB90-1) TaxID=452637 RepID=B1ZPY1_OPITP|nr:efflux RND transporter periplasmic adaptor subunit [Opitutus terrae]ACB77702.1 efflux transporter, RND family, MFP subunit [Opitutus terrae PB90-1]
MKTSLRFLSVIFLALALAAGLVAAEQLYTCGMHPQIIKKEPGNCPICGMKLTPIRANTAKASGSTAGGERKVKYYKSTMIPGEVKTAPGKDSMGMDMVPVYEGEDTSAENNIQIDAATTQRMNLKTALVEQGPVRREFRTVGLVAYNEEGLRDITTKYEGWIEKLMVNTTWTLVKAGDPLFEIYSPDVYNAQLNYVLALRAEKEQAGPLTRAALARLQLFDVSPEFIAELKRSGEPSRRMVFHAPTDGWVIEKMAVVGQMMKPGERIYRLADLSSVWVEAQIYEKDLPYLSSGQDATVRSSYGPQRTFEGTVQLLLPQVEAQTRTATARIVLPNPEGFLRPGMFVDVNFSAQLAANAVLVPDIAVLRSGERNTVFIALDGGFFEAREIKLGARSSGNFYEVLSGLRVGDRVVTSGQFMLDSESQLREAIQKMLKSAEGVPTANAQATPSAPAAHEHAAPAATPREEGALAPAAHESESAVAMLRPLAFGLADAAAALAIDDLAGYQKQLPVIRAALTNYFKADAHAAHGPLGKFKDGLSVSTDLAAARTEFEPLSTAVADLAREHHLHHTEGLHVFECTMAPVTGTARWLQRKAGTQNPFFGTKMSGCGDEITGTEATGGTSGGMAMALPPGHPPIDQVSVAAYLRSQTTGAAVAATSGDGKCGSCGMSQAEMAAGLCEHDKK